jgi:hypothetical protein
MLIFAKLISGKIVSLEVEPLTTVAEVKQMISEAEEIAISKQRLFSAGKELVDDNINLFECRINFSLINNPHNN